MITENEGGFMGQQAGWCEKLFRLKENNTTVRTEVFAGITTFMTMAYILAVNPGILSAAGMDAEAVFTATAVASIIGTLVMALYANLPFALAPGMGLNAFFAFTVVGIMGYSWQMALAAVFVEGIIFIILSFFNVREAIINSIPMVLKNAISAGIGLFIALIGLTGAGVVIAGTGTVVALGDITQPAPLLALVGVLIIGFLLAKNVKGAILYGILAVTVLGIPFGVTNVENLSLVKLPPSLGPIFMKMDFANFFTWDMAIIVFTFLFVDMFDTVGTLVGVSTKANMLDKDGRVPHVKQALMADAIATTAGAVLGTSTVTTYVESAAGVAEGGRTGLTALSTAGMFVVALFLSPLFLMVPAAATAPALIVVGLFMMTPILKVNFEDYTDALPAFFTLIMMPFGYSIADGIIFGMISYVALKLMTGKHKEVHLLTYVIALIFVLKFVLEKTL
jgi:adenine/guanine/hypoxanthine permease